MPSPQPEYGKHLFPTLAKYGLKGLHPFALEVPWSTEEEYVRLRENIRAGGIRFPVEITPERYVLDGRIRLCAAAELGVEVPILVVQTEDEVGHILSRNEHRALTVGQRAALALAAEAFYAGDAKERQRMSGGGTGRVGGDKRTVPPNSAEPFLEARQQAARAVGVAGTAVSTAKKLRAEAPDLLEKVAAGAVSLHAADKERKERSIVSAGPTFNETNEKIEWAKWSWNPVTGCLHGCPYCYARDIATRFNGGFEPKFHAQRLAAPANTTIPKARQGEPGIRNVFVCSMADLFGKWVPREWIEAVLASVRESQQWDFLFLTKNPQRYAEFDFPENAWIGATADTQARMDEAMRVFSTLLTGAAVKFVSCEPMNEPVILPAAPPIDWLIVGGRSASSGMPAFQPEWPWVEDLLRSARAGNVLVYFKPNLTARPMEYPHNG